MDVGTLTRGIFTSFSVHFQTDIKEYFRCNKSQNIARCFQDVCFAIIYLPIPMLSSQQQQKRCFEQLGLLNQALVAIKTVYILFKGSSTMPNWLILKSRNRAVRVLNSSYHDLVPFDSD